MSEENKIDTIFGLPNKAIVRRKYKLDDYVYVNYIIKNGYGNPTMLCMSRNLNNRVERV
jgi:hypothetical protein